MCGDFERVQYKDALMVAAARAPMTAAFRAAAAAWAATVAFLVCSTRRVVSAVFKMCQKSRSCPLLLDTPQHLKTRAWGGALMSEGASYPGSILLQTIRPGKQGQVGHWTDLPGRADAAGAGVPRG
jgi:hypothetical protein